MFSSPKNHATALIALLLLCPLSPLFRYHNCVAKLTFTNLYLLLCVIMLWSFHHYDYVSFDTAFMLCFKRVCAYCCVFLCDLAWRVCNHISRVVPVKHSPEIPYWPFFYFHLVICVDLSFHSLGFFQPIVLLLIQANMPDEDDRYCVSEPLCFYL